MQLYLTWFCSLIPPRAPTPFCWAQHVLGTGAFDLPQLSGRNSSVTFTFSKELCSFSPSCSEQSNLIHLIMWCVAIAAMNPAAATQKTDKKLGFFPLSTHLIKVRIVFLCSKSNADRLMPPVRAKLWQSLRRKTQLNYTFCFGGLGFIFKKTNELTVWNHHWSLTQLIIIFLFQPFTGFKI